MPNTSSVRVTCCGLDACQFGQHRRADSEHIGAVEASWRIHIVRQEQCVNQKGLTVCRVLGHRRCRIVNQLSNGDIANHQGFATSFSVGTSGAQLHTVLHCKTRHDVRHHGGCCNNAIAGEVAQQATVCWTVYRALAHRMCCWCS